MESPSIHINTHSIQIQRLYNIIVKWFVFLHKIFFRFFATQYEKQLEKSYIP